MSWLLPHGGLVTLPSKIPHGDGTIIGDTWAGTGNATIFDGASGSGNNAYLDPTDDHVWIGKDWGSGTTYDVTAVKLVPGYVSSGNFWNSPLSTELTWRVRGSDSAPSTHDSSSTIIGSYNTTTSGEINPGLGVFTARIINGLTGGSFRYHWIHTEDVSSNNGYAYIGEVEFWINGDAT